MESFTDDHSGETGVQKHSNPLTPVSIDSLPEVPTIPQKVRFFTARNTFIAEEIADSSVETMSAIKFDAFISPLFADIPDIDREEWSLANRIYALNAALLQQESRKAKQQPYIRLDLLLNGRLLISAINLPSPITEEQKEELPPDAA